MVAILRGVVPEGVVEIGDVLYDAGIRIIEVPLNSPDPFASIAKLVACGRPDWTIGAGTVLNVDDVRRTNEVGGRLVVAPNLNADVIGCALQRLDQFVGEHGNTSEVMIRRSVFSARWV